jgi:hypothetical protein
MGRILTITPLHLMTATANHIKPVSLGEVQIPDELEYLLAEAAEDLEIIPDELVRQAVSSYSRERNGGRHE